ncbi:IucA/IucC family protein [Rubrobacter taiwanensis]|jgi:siderophore synthetase component|uniref:IucA/IucC family protein n=1 Tax=Rubrobacter taiwanensis TaxID=185139 RepID=A0A4R1B8L6_9ACTN|nr:IucA/IucC family protein [Rubrobacter taiwanensis]TCJ13065.1 IucA/IucC family protein [Rubrobacter taiwanensis]
MSPPVAGSRLRETPEARVLRFLEEERPELAGAFREALGGARRAVMRRLLESALREDLCGLHSRLRLDGELASVSLPAERLVFGVKTVRAFRRFEVGEVWLVAGEAARPAGSATELISALREAGEASLAWDGLERELSNAAANLALARAYAGQVGERLRERAAGLGAGDSLELAALEELPAGLFFERLGAEGHNLHPSAKTKLGMEPRAVLRHSPELDGEAPLRFVAVHRDRLRSASVSGEGFEEVLGARLPGVRERAAAELAEAGLRAEDYALVPVHPWQYERVLPEVYAGEVARQEVVPVRGVCVPARATASFRTVVPEGARLAVKVAVSSQMTSTVRSISPQTALNAPEITRILREIMAREPDLARTFVPVSELAGVHFAGDTGEKRRSLSAVLREGVDSHLEPGDLPVAGCALYAESPVTGKTVLAELVEAHACATGSASLQEAAVSFVGEYAGIAVPGFLTLMSVYGVGLEGHLQNCVPVFRQGRPAKLLFRDWGGARIHAGRLERSGIEANLAPGSLTLADSVGEMRRKVLYTVFQNHLGEVVLQASKGFGVPERELWREVRRACEEVFQILASRPGSAPNTLSDRRVLYAPEIPHKALTRMRLDPGKGDIYVSVPNPLCKAGQQEKRGGS